MPTDTVLTAELLRQFLLYDPLTGAFTWLPSTGRGQGKRPVGGRAGSERSDGYWRITVLWKRYEAGRLAWLYMTGGWPTGDIDHINGNPRDNSWRNLRDIPHRHNSENRRRPNKQNKTGLLGVRENKKRPGFFIAQISSCGRCKYLGDFPSPEQAHEAYLEAKRRIHEGNTL